METKGVYINTLVDHETNDRLRTIALRRSIALGGQYISRSDMVRMAVSEFIAKYEVVSISNLPHPPGAESVPLVVVREVQA